MNNLKYQIQQESLETILKLYNISDFTWEQAKSGAENTTIFISAGNEEYVLRVYRSGSRTDEQVLEEIEFVSFLINYDIPVAKILTSLDGQFLTKITLGAIEWQVVLMNRIEGSEISSQFWAEDRELISQIAQTQARMHLVGIEFAKLKNQTIYDPLVSASGNGLMLRDKMNQIKDHQYQDPELLKIISGIQSLNYTYPLNLSCGYIHDDIYRRNLIVSDDNQVSVIDFGDLRFGPLISCLGSTIFATGYAAYFNKVNMTSLCNHYLESYNHIRQISQEELNEIFKVMELSVDTYIAVKILEAGTVDERVKEFVKLKNLIGELKFV